MAEIIFYGPGKLWSRIYSTATWILLYHNPCDGDIALQNNDNNIVVQVQIPHDAVKLKIIYDKDDREVSLGPIWYSKVILASEPIYTADAFRPNGSSEAIVTRPFIFTDEIVEKIKRGVFHGRKK